MGLILAADYVWGRFEHTARSRRVLASVAVASYAAALACVAAVLKPGRWLLALAWAVIIWLPLYLIAALTAVELWRRRKLASFDRAIRQLQRELAQWRDTVDRLTWEIRELERRVPAEPRPVRREADAGTGWRDRVESWEGRGSLARVRSLKVAEWRQELAGLDAAALAERLHHLEGALADAEPDRREQLEVQAALVHLRQQEQARPVPEREPEETAPRDALDAARRRRAEAERELARLQSRLGEWQQNRAAFVRQRIQLD